MKDLKRKIVVYFLVMPSLLYIPCCSNYMSSYEHERVWVDVGRRIPLWYPYEIVEDHGRVFVSKWGGGVIPVKEGEACSLDHVTKFHLTTNLFFGEQVLEGGEGVEVKRYFIFSAGNSQVRYYSTEGDFLSACSMYGVDARDRRSFEDNFRRVVKDDGLPAPWSVLAHLFRHGLSLCEIFICVVFALGCRCLERSKIGRLPVLTL